MRPPLLTLALLGPLPASAFYPTKFRANLSMIPGISHEQMTEEVLTSAAGTLFPPVASSLHGALGVTLSRAMLEARTEIVWSNVRVDRGDSVPAWHFDGESDAVSADLLEGLKAALVKDLGDEDYGQARVNLGKALHLVQDYFAYRFVFRADASWRVRSRALTNGSSDAAMDGQDFEQLWQRDLFLQAALGSDDSQAGENDGEHSNLQKKGAEESQQDIIGLAPGDSDRHLHAVRWAKKASEAFITNVAQYVTDRQLQHLFGISLDSVILVDPVAFTSSDWDNAQVKVSAMFDAARDFDPQENRAARQSIVALLSQSPMVTYDNWSPLKSTNASQSLEMLRDTVSGYGIGCHGIDPATVLSALEQFRGGGELVLVVGQGFLADSDVEDQIVDFLANNPVAVTIMQLETKCQQQKTFSKEASTLSQSVADLSGGAYVTSLDTRQALAFPRDGALAAPAALSVIQKNSHTNATSGDDIRFLVDGAMDRLVITADWVSREKAPTSLRFSDPEDKSFEPVARSTSGSTQRAVWKIDNPTPGEWGFNFGGSAPSYNVTIKGRSPIQLVDVSFVESGGVAGHEGFFQIEKEVLPAEADLGVVSELYGLSSEDHPSVEWFIVEAATGDETKISMTPGLDPKERPGFADQNTFFGKATLPKGEFYVVVRGEDSEGYKFQRSVPSRLSAKYYPDETYNIGDVDSVVDFPDDSEEESEAEAEAEAEEMYRIVARQIMTGTGTGTGTPPLTPSGPFLTNATAFPGTGATTVGTNATATSLFPTLPTSVLPSIPGTSGFNTSVPSVTIPGQTSANFTDSESATETAGPVQGTASTVPTSPSVPGATESFTTVATIPSPGPLGTNSTSGIPSTSFGANATATSVTAKGETGGASATT